MSTQIHELGDASTPLNENDYFIVSQSSASKRVPVSSVSSSGVISVKSFGAKGTGTDDDTAAIQAAINSGAAAIFFPAGTYKVGVGNVQISLVSNQMLYGEKGASFIKAASDFTTTMASEAAYKFLLYGSSVSNVTIQDLSFLLSSTSASQSKIGFKTSSNLSVSGCYFQENSTSDVMFNACSNFSFTNNNVECGVSGTDTGVGLRVCGASKRFTVANNRFYGSLVTKPNEGLGVQPSGDKWASVHFNIDNGATNHVNSNGFQGGKGRIVTDGTGNPVALTIAGLTAADWLAWVEPGFTVKGISSSSQRTPTATVTTNTLTITGLPGGPPLEYIYYYAYFGTTPSDGVVTGNSFIGSTYSCLSMINGRRITVSGNSFAHCGDVAFDPEGCIDITCTGNSFYDCNTAGLVPCFNTVFSGNNITGGGQSVSFGTDAGSGYQSFYGGPGVDYANSSFESATITVGSASGNYQTITGTNAFTWCFLNEYLSVKVGSDWLDYKITTKTDNSTIIIDYTTVRYRNAPSTSPTPAAIPATTYTQGNWQKAPYAEPWYGIVGNSVVSGNNIDNVTVGFVGDYVKRSLITNNSISRTNRAIEFTNSQDISISGGLYTGRVWLKDCSGVNINSVEISRAYQRGLLLDGVQFFNVSNLIARDLDIYGNTGTPSIVYGNCSYGTIANCLLALQNGDSSNGQPTIVEGIFNWAGNSISYVSPNNTAVFVKNVQSLKYNSYAMDHIETFAADDATPSVSLGELFITANVNPTNVTTFDDGFVGKIIHVYAGDAITTIKNGTTIKTKTAADVTMAAGAAMSFCQFSAGVWSEI